MGVYVILSKSKNCRETCYIFKIQRFRLNVSINLEVHQVQSCLKLLSSLPGSSTKIFPFDPFAVLLESILRSAKDTKTRRDEEARTICSLNTQQKKGKKPPRPRTGICWIMFPAHTHVLQGFFEREIVFFFPFSILEFDTFGCIVSIPRDRAKADNL